MGTKIILPIPPSFAKTIARRRREVGLTLKQLAPTTGVSYQSIVFVEAGGKETSFNVAARIAHALGLPFEVISDALREALDIATRDMYGYRTRRSAICKDENA